jgi:soluble lytic murein transglycosylase-like protein
MKRFSPAIVLILLIGAPALAQSTASSFNNLDAPNGVRVYMEPTRARASGTEPRRASKTGPTKKTASQSNPFSTPSADSSRSLLRPTALIYAPDLSAVANKGSSLRGYTTGSVQVDGYLIAAGTNNGVDPLLLYSIMHQESSFKSHAVSPKGARGLMQLMPSTASRYGVANIFDPRQNIEGGARYLRFLLDYFDGDLNLALAGYNAGEGAVEKYGWRIPPYSETQEYVRRISRRYALLRDPSVALYASRLTTAQLARMQSTQTAPLTVYERTVFTVRLPDGRLQLMSQ